MFELTLVSALVLVLLNVSFAWCCCFMMFVMHGVSAGVAW